MENNNKIRAIVYQIIKEYYEDSTRSGMNSQVNVGDAYHQLEEKSLEETDKEQGVDKIMQKINDKLG